MLQLLFDGRRKKAKAVLANRVNKTQFAELQGVNRESDRSSFCRVVYVIPEAVRGWNFDRAATAISRDISAHGLSLIHREAIESQRLLIGLPDDGTPKFLACKVEHCSDLGFNYFQIGLSVDEVLPISSHEVVTIERRLAENQ